MLMAEALAFWLVRWLQVALLNATVGDQYGEPLQGYSQGESDVVMQRNAANIEITWRGGKSRLPQGVPFRVMVAWRDGTVYAAYVGTRVAPRW